ncbi:glutaredoxin family protein [Candidatus Contubernalis alkalaceticus]|uniref:glutaredoxin family protein n=1 Tax=Candidatus Contubernalis alkaliaceticus TaxID=338645 RepID=UPI00387EAAFD|nr:glutaredoxin family protein [Candidatus Contubernalis alkalaceticus]
MVYIKTGCPHCQKLMEDLKSKSISYVEIDVSKDQDAKSFVKDILKVDKVPVVIKEGKVESVGFEGKG